MDNEPNTPHVSDEETTTNQQEVAKANGRVQIAISTTTMDALARVRTTLINKGAGDLPVPVQAVLHDATLQFTKESMIRTSTEALIWLLEHPAVPEEKFSPEIEEYIALVQQRSNIDRYEAIHKIIGWEKSRADTFAPHAGSHAPELGSPTDVAARAWAKDTTITPTKLQPVRDVRLTRGMPASKGKAKR